MKVHIVCVNDSGAAYMAHQSITHGESGSNIMGQDKNVAEGTFWGYFLENMKFH